MKNARRTGSTQLPILRDVNRLLLKTERAVHAFPRYHKYTIGNELRTPAMRLCRLLTRAIAAADEKRLCYVQQLVDTIGDLKIAIQPAKELKAFSGFNTFQRQAELVVAIGKQGGAWLRHLCRPFRRKSGGYIVAGGPRPVLAQITGE